MVERLWTREPHHPECERGDHAPWEYCLKRGTPIPRQDWLDVMERLQNIRDEIMGKLSKIDEALNGLIASGNRVTQNPTEQSGSVDPHEREHPDTGETQLEFALRTESEIREAAWRARSTPTEPPHSYPHDIG